MRAIAIESDDAALTVRSEVREDGGEAGDKALACLAHYRYAMAHEANQLIDVRRRAHYRDLDTAQAPR